MIAFAVLDGDGFRWFMCKCFFLHRKLSKCDALRRIVSSIAKPHVDTLQKKFDQERLLMYYVQ